MDVKTKHGIKNGDGDFNLCSQKYFILEIEYRKIIILYVVQKGEILIALRIDNFL